MLALIDFPFHVGRLGRTASTDYSDHVRDMIEQLLLTEPGERVNRPDFGGGVRQLVFAPNSPELAGTLMFTLRAAMQQWLGDVVEVEELDVRADDSRLIIDLRYRLRETDEPVELQVVRPR